MCISDYFTAVTLSSEGTPNRFTACAYMYFQPRCLGEKIIAVQSIQYGTKLTGSCSSSDCCLYSNADCLLPYNYNYTAIHEYCSGKKLCSASSPSAADASSCGAGYSIISDYLTMEYYCLSGKFSP